MSERTDEPQDWPLRDWSTRLRPPGRHEHADPFGPAGDEAAEAGPPGAPEPPPEAGPGAEILYEEASPTERPDPGRELEQVPPPERESGLDPAAEPVYERADPAVEEQDPAAAEEHAGADFRVPDGYSVLEGAPTGRRRSVAVVVSRFNAEITNRLLDSALAELVEAGVAQDAVLVMPVPGAFELPIAAMALAKSRRYACVVALGCVIRGETPHFDFVASEAASGIQLAGIETGVPVSFGLLTTETVEQALARIDRGAEAARTALEMADAFAQLRASAAAALGQ